VIAQSIIKSNNSAPTGATHASPLATALLKIYAFQSAVQIFLIDRVNNAHINRIFLWKIPANRVPFIKADALIPMRLD